MKRVRKFLTWIRENKIFKSLMSKYVKIGIWLGIGLFAGWLFFHSPAKHPVDNHDHETASSKEEIWTCAMHPHIRMPEPGKCPICGMDLIPLSQAGETANPDAVMLSAEAMALANIHTSVVSRQRLSREVRLYGKVQPDERLIQSQPAHIPGRIEELQVNFTGETVRKGQTLARIYSPELIKAQQDLLEALKMNDLQPAILEAARERLRQWKLTGEQIDAIEQSGKISTEFPVLANVSGVVMARRVNVGEYINRGTILFDIADLSRLWVLFDAYEQDLPFIRTGDKIRYTLQAMPGKTFTGTVKFVDPFVDPATRVAKVRVEIPNENGLLKPEMFATGLIEARLDGHRDKLVIPRSAVLWTGKRSVVYIRLPDIREPTFRMREITLGPLLGNSYVVLEGLTEGEEIVTEGTFSVDAAAQLEGKPSMMNPSGGKIPAGHDHGTMEVKDEASLRDGIDPAFHAQLKALLAAYLPMKDALVDSDPGTVQGHAGHLQHALGRTDMNLLRGQAHEIWMKQLPLLEKPAGEMNRSSDLEEQRKAFARFNLALYKVIKAFGWGGEILYYQYCPMAFDNKGAYWFSTTSEIRNPYFGEAMLKCGETREELRNTQGID